MGPVAAITISVVLAEEVFSTPAEMSARTERRFYVADTAGILTAWIFNRDDLSPHRYLLTTVREGDPTDLGAYADRQAVMTALGSARADARNAWDTLVERDVVGSLRTGDPEEFWTTLAGLILDANNITGLERDSTMAYVNSVIDDVQDFHERMAAQRRRFPPHRARRRIHHLVPAAARISDISFDHGADKVIIEAANPGVLTTRHQIQGMPEGYEYTLRGAIQAQTGWMPEIRRVRRPTMQP